MEASILVVDDNADLGKVVGIYLRQQGLTPLLLESSKRLFEEVNEDTQVVILDIHLPGEMDGIACLRQLKKAYPHVEVIMLTAVDNARSAVDALRLGAFDYLIKPFDPEELGFATLKARELSDARRKAQELGASFALAPSSGVVGESRHTLDLMEQIKRLAPLPSSILITGESGTGKGVAARAIHAASTRSAGPFITVNCPSLPRELLTSEMFGHEKGAFTGAHQRRIGRVEMANGGTLFLDEIGDLPLDLQPKLLNFLQEKKFQRVGGGQDISVNVRIIAATNHELRGMVARREFREDLYYRLNVVPLRLLPLRERKEDIPLLVHAFLRRIAAEREIKMWRLSPAASDCLLQYDWPGNVRELENAMERATALCQGDVIEASHLSSEILGVDDGLDPAGVGSSASRMQLAGRTLEDIEACALEQTLRACGGNKAKAARLLGISEKSVYNKLRLKPPESKAE